MSPSRPDEIEALKVESKKTIDLQQFIDVGEIDPRYFEKPYYIVPADAHAAEGYLVIRDALRGMNKMGVGQITMSGREHIVAVGPVETGLVMEVLRYAEELRSAKPYFSDLPSIKLDEEMVGLARELISRKAAPFEPGRFHDSYAAGDAPADRGEGQGQAHHRPSLGCSTRRKGGGSPRRAAQEPQEQRGGRCRNPEEAGEALPQRAEEGLVRAPQLFGVYTAGFTAAWVRAAS